MEELSPRQRRSTCSRQSFNVWGILIISDNAYSTARDYYHAYALSSQVTLRNVFTQQGYREAAIGLITRRRMPFQSVEWSNMKDLPLACNPFIEDLLITSSQYCCSLYCIKLLALQRADTG